MKNSYIKSPMNYTGGKYKLLPQILPFFPTEINTFVDLFTGGGNIAVNVNANKIIANDNEKHVIDIYKAFQNGYDNVDNLIHTIELIIETYGLNIEDAEPFNKLREDYNTYKLRNRVHYPFDLNILLYVLICYSFNHQFRFNSRGEFNMPFGKNRSQWNDNMKKNLINFHKAITEKKIIFTNKDFKELKIDKLSCNDFVYCDPPYLITCATYNEKDGWNEQCETDLLNLLDSLNSKSVKFALSNVLFSKGKTNDLLIEWSKKYNVHHLDYTYQNCNYHTKDKSSKPDEVLITNF
jgi:DNA adenine methylase Dam